MPVVAGGESHGKYSCCLEVPQKKGAWGAEEIYELLLSSYLWVGQTYPEAKGRQMVGKIVPLIQSRVGNGQRMDQSQQIKA